jgi:hypothetical protein
MESTGRKIPNLMCLVLAQQVPASTDGRTGDHFELVTSHIDGLGVADLSVRVKKW